MLLAASLGPEVGLIRVEGCQGFGLPSSLARKAEQTEEEVTACSRKGVAGQHPVQQHALPAVLHGHSQAFISTHCFALGPKALEYPC